MKDGTVQMCHEVRYVITTSGSADDEHVVSKFARLEDLLVRKVDKHQESVVTHRSDSFLSQVRWSKISKTIMIDGEVTATLDSTATVGRVKVLDIPVDLPDLSRSISIIRVGSEYDVQVAKFEVVSGKA